MATPDYSGAAWHGASSNNYSSASRPGSDPINKIIIHVTQGSWSSAINWFNNGSAQVSAHYTVRSSDGHIGQSVQEKDIGWHAGNWEYNRTSIGIEHEGYVSDPKWFTDAMYSSSARLSAYLCGKYGLPADRAHILGHNEVPGATHTDPGGNWDWARYMSYVREYSAPAPAPAPSPAPPAAAAGYEFVVDNATAGRFAAAAGVWKTSTYSGAKYGPNYRYANPGRITSHAKFKVAVPATAQYTVYARWPASAGYNNRAVFRIFTTSGWVSKRVNQRGSGGRWIPLGTYALNAGDSYAVQLSNRTSGDGYIVADAVKIVRA